MTADLPSPKLAGVGLIGSLVFEFLGVPLQPVVWALIGGFLGAGFAKPTTFAKSIGIYLSASLLSSLFGSATAEHFFPGNSIISSAMCAIISLVFHPALAVLVERLPMVFDAILGALGKRGAP